MNSKKQYNPLMVIKYFSKVLTNNSKSIPKDYSIIYSPFGNKTYELNSVEGLLSVAIYSGILNNKPKYIVNPKSKRKVILEKENGKKILKEYLDIIQEILRKNIQLGGSKSRLLKKATEKDNEEKKDESFQLKPILGYGASSMLGLGVEAFLQAGKFFIGLIPEPIRKLPGEVKEAALNGSIDGEECSQKKPPSITDSMIKNNLLNVSHNRIVSLIKNIKKYQNCSV